MPAPDEKEQQRKWREGNAVGAVAGVMVLALLIAGLVVAIVFFPAFKAATPTVPPGLEEQQVE